MKVAILIDGGYFLKRIYTVRPDISVRDATQVDKAIGQFVYNHLTQINKVAGVSHALALLYRCFFYDATPYTKKGHLPVSRRAIDYAKSDEALFRLRLFDLLRKRASFVVRLGEVRRERAWILSEQAQKDLLEKKRTVESLVDADFTPGFRQKAVDMRIGVDITSISLKQQADTVTLVTGDSDFVPAAKLARREGVKIILDPMWRSVEASLFEHIDGLRSGFARPKNTTGADSNDPAVF
ncbi:MAG: NYN domain-containing protein [Magnetococcales bacterium]|nr:NYN domain-containing protein [Magnetococcales bacterium]